MSLASAKERLHPIPSIAILGFLTVTFLITWGLSGFYVLAPDIASARLGEINGSHPFFFLATRAPAISALGLVLFYSGTAGFRAFLSRFFLWRVSAGWMAFTLIVVPLVFVGGSLIKGGSVLAAVESGRTMTPDTRMLAANIGKTFVAATVLALESAGAVAQSGLLADHLGDRPWEL